MLHFVRDGGTHLHGACSASNDGYPFAFHRHFRIPAGGVKCGSVEGLGTIRNRVVAEEDAPQDWRWRPGTPLKAGF